MTIQPLILMGIPSRAMRNMKEARPPAVSLSAAISLPPNQRIAPVAAVKMKVISEPCEAKSRVAE